MKTPIILQTESAECGLACLAMIANYHGLVTDIVTLRKRFSVSAQGLNLQQLADLATEIGFTYRALRAEMDELAQLSLPCVLHWGLDHFVVLQRVSSRYCVVHDPASGIRRLSHREFAKRFTGIVLEITPNEDFVRTKQTSRLRIKDLSITDSGIHSALLIILLLSIAVQVFAMLAPFCVQLAIDKVIQQANTDLLLPIVIGFVFVLISQIACSLLREYAVLRISSLLSLRLAASLFSHLVRLPMDYFIKRHLGDVMSRFGSLAPLRQFFTTGIVSAFLDCMTATVTLLILLRYSVKLTLIVLGVVTVFLAIRVLFYRPIKRINEEKILESSKESSHFMESIRAIQTIKIFQKESDRQSQWMNRLVAVLNKDVSASKWAMGFGATSTFLFGFENIAIVALGANLVLSSRLTLGMFFAYLTYKTYFTSAVTNLVTQGINFKMLDIHLDRISDIVFTEREILAKDAQHVVKHAQIAGNIEVRNVAYRFSRTEGYVFNNVALTIGAGETLAITGPSGCGKTTLLKCLAGLLTPTEGEILVDGIPLSVHADYRSQIATVMQDDELLSGSIGENIALFESPINWEKVHRCAALACIHDDIQKMPMQYNTLVGDMGSVLSGGQKQRIVLARALYREPRILFMDEATSHLDVHNEALVNQNISSLSITRILVAHRPETVRSAGKQFAM